MRYGPLLFDGKSSVKKEIKNITEFLANGEFVLLRHDKYSLWNLCVVRMKSGKDSGISTEKGFSQEAYSCK